MAGFDGESGTRMQGPIAPAPHEQFRQDAFMRADVLNQQYGSGHRHGQRRGHVEQ